MHFDFFKRDGIDWLDTVLLNNNPRRKRVEEVGGWGTITVDGCLYKARSEPQTHSILKQDGWGKLEGLIEAAIGGLATNPFLLPHPARSIFRLPLRLIWPFSRWLYCPPFASLTVWHFLLAPLADTRRALAPARETSFFARELRKRKLIDTRKRQEVKGQRQHGLLPISPAPNANIEFLWCFAFTEDKTVNAVGDDVIGLWRRRLMRVFLK